MLDSITTIACLMLMGWAMPVATIIGRGLWARKASLALVLLGLMLMAVNPWTQWWPPMPAVGTFVFLAADIMIAVWWREAWGYMLSEFSGHQAA